MKVFIHIGIVVLLVFASACNSSINRLHHTPKKPFVYPLFTQADSLHGALNPYRTCFDVTFYSLNIEVNPAEKSVAGSVAIYFKAIRDFDTLQLDLFANMHIDSVLCESKLLSYKRVCNAFFVSMPFAVRRGDSKELVVYYHGKPTVAAKPPWDGGMVWRTSPSGKPWCGVACEKIGASLWWPVKDHLTDEPDSMDLAFTIPSGLYCVSNGSLVDSINNGSKTTYKWHVAYPINTYNATFYIGDFRRFEIPYQGLKDSFNFSFYVLAKNIEKAKEHFKQTEKIIRFYEKTFGEYPWPADGYKLIESPYEGMEHQSAIAYGNNYRNSYNLFDYIILHETAHEWWGNSVTASDYAQVWIHEGFATYCEALYLEYLKGHYAYLTYLKFYSYFILNKRPVVGPENVNYWDENDGDVYFKGALILHTLRNTMDNDSLFFDILKTFYQNHKYKIATSANFEAIVNAKTGQNYHWFFSQYLYNRTCPLLEWNVVTENDGNTYIYYRWANVTIDFPLMISIETDKERFPIHPSEGLKRVKLADGYTTITINPFHSYIAEKKVRHLGR